MPWNTSDRRSRLPKNWEAIRQATKRRAGDRCEWAEGGTRCTSKGSECDHIDGNDDHARTQWLCMPHHKVKTQREAQAARFRRSNTKRATPRPIGQTP